LIKPRIARIISTSIYSLGSFLFLQISKDNKDWSTQILVNPILDQKSKEYNNTILGLHFLFFMTKLTIVVKKMAEMSHFQNLRKFKLPGNVETKPKGVTQTATNVADCQRERNHDEQLLWR